MLIAIPSAVGFSILSYEIVGSMYGSEGHSDTASILASLGVAVIFYCVCTFLNAVLQGIGKLYSPVINSLIALAIQTVALELYVKYTNVDYGVFGLVLATTVYAMVMFVLDLISVKRYLAYKQDYLKIYIKPILASIMMGIVVYLVKLGLIYIKMNIYLTLVICLVVAIVTYLKIIVKLKILDDEILDAIPKLKKLTRYFK